MKIAEIGESVRQLVLEPNQDRFLYELLAAYGQPKASITRLESKDKGSYNLSKVEGVVLWKKKVLYAATVLDDIEAHADALANSPAAEKHDPRFIIVTNFNRLYAIDTRTDEVLDIFFVELSKHFDFFLPWANMEKAGSVADNQADVKAAEKMARLFDLIKADNPSNDPAFIHSLNVFLSRLLFCFFAEDTGIFEEKLFSSNVESHTQNDGSDLHLYLDQLFTWLDTEKRTATPPYFVKFPFVNGGLFSQSHPSPIFKSKSRALLIECGSELNWAEINPDIFGSMIQAVVDVKQRGNMGMHYTNVQNIMKVIEPLFLDELNEAFGRAKNSPKKLYDLLNRIRKIRLFDPACGSGNFLIVSYRELRKLEMEIFNQIATLSRQPELGITGVQLSQFFGIELDDFAHEVALLAMWLAEHQMNLAFVKRFGKFMPTLPLKPSGNIVQGNALRMSWTDVCPKDPEFEVYVLGNPPYLGSRNQGQQQKDDLESVFKNDYKSLDYVSAWYYLGSKYIAGTSHRLAFVSTNSICQGEQVALLWPRILVDGVDIDFAHQSFKWSNSAKHNAGVICVVIGLATTHPDQRRIYGNNVVTRTKQINPYLVAGPVSYISRRSCPISNQLPAMVYGSLLNDAGNLVLSTSEKDQMTEKHPGSAKFVRPFIGSKEFIRGLERWVLYIADSDLPEARRIPEISHRLDKVAEHRANSTESSTVKLAEMPNRYYFSAYNGDASLIVPRTSSERRQYIPVGFIPKDAIASDSTLAIYSPEPWVMGVVSSRMHMVWMRAVAGRMKTDYRYSVALCYNTFPLPTLSSQTKADIEALVFRLMSVREVYAEKSLAELYDPVEMPDPLRAAHHMLDQRVEACYKKTAFVNDDERLALLFNMFEEMTGHSND